MALAIFPNVAAELRDADEAIETANRCANYCEEQRLPFFLSWSQCARGYALALKGRSVEGLSEIEAGMAALEQFGSPAFSLWQGRRWAEARIINGDSAMVLSVLPEHLETIKESGQIWLEPGTLLLLGQASLHQDPADTDKAVEYFQLALESARKQDGKQPEIRAATSLARLWHSQGKYREAHDILAPVYGWFTEGLDTADLKEAKELLNELN